MRDEDTSLDALFDDITDTKERPSPATPMCNTCMVNEQLERLVRLQPVWYNIRWQKAGGAEIACRGLPTGQLSQTGASLSHLSLGLATYHGLARSSAGGP